MLLFLCLHVEYTLSCRLMLELYNIEKTRAFMLILGTH